MEKKFSCTACGRCCSGWLPLTVDESLTFAGQFPLAMIWTPLRTGHKIADALAKTGVPLTMSDRRKIIVKITPVSYLPPAFSCPLLAEGGLCSIHPEKPLRCRTMPFYPWRAEADQLPNLIPRQGWLCDVSPQAPVVYRDKTMTDRTDFDREYTALVRQRGVLATYAERIMDRVPATRETIRVTSLKPAGGDVVMDFHSLLLGLPGVDVRDIAAKQVVVLQKYQSLTADDPSLKTYFRHYSEMLTTLVRLAGIN